jgi:hypothetical protein
MRKTFIILGIIILGNSIYFAQNKQTVTHNNEQQWEYIVISFGKTVFGSPEKTLAYKELGIQNGSESISLQSNLDILGRFGWEVVSTLGTIGGDQQLVFKRKYDKTRSANEYGLIQNGKELYLKDLKDIVERSLQLEEERKRIVEQNKNKPRLVNLDQVEREKKRKELNQRLENVYKKRFESTELSKHSSFEFSPKNYYSSDIAITIDVDLTEKYLLNGNSYHGDEVDKYLKSCAESLRYRDPEIGDYTGISIRLNGFIKFNGENIDIGYTITEQGYKSSDWH